MSRRYSSMPRHGLYRSRHGIIFGVCRGVADYFDFPVIWIRAIAVILFIFTGFWPVIGIYILAALLMKPEPLKDIGTGSKHRAGIGTRCERSHTADRLKRKWKQLENRIRSMEDKVTSREFDWHNRFHG